VRNIGLHTFTCDLRACYPYSNTYARYGRLFSGRVLGSEQGSAVGSHENCD